MRKIFNLFSVMAISGLVFFANCGPDPDPDADLTAQQQRAIDLNGTWAQSTTDVLPDGVDPTVLDNLTMTFNKDDNHAPTSFSSSGAPDFFTTTSSSIWAFSGSDINIIALTGVEGGVSGGLKINSFTTTQMTLNFEFVTTAGRLEGNERIAGYDGDYTVVMTKN